MPNIYSLNKVNKVGLDYALSICDYSRPSNETVTSLSLSSITPAWNLNIEKLLTDQGLKMICTYISFGFYPHLTTMDLDGGILLLP